MGIKKSCARKEGKSKKRSWKKCSKILQRSEGVYVLPNRRLDYRGKQKAAVENVFGLPGVMRNKKFPEPMRRIEFERITTECVCFAWEAKRALRVAGNRNARQCVQTALPTKRIRIVRVR